MDQKLATYGSDGSVTGFYESADALPPGAASVEITDDEWLALLDAQSKGKLISIGSDGQPVISDRPAPSAVEIAADNAGTRDALLSKAAIAIAPLQDAVDLDEATAEETALLKLWKQYRVAVNRVDLTLPAPNWPAPPSA
jgi:hypothetical protein